MSLLYLVGSNHWDLKGPERLKKFLGFIRPGYICLEASEQSVKMALSDRELIKAEIEKEKRFNEIMERLIRKKGSDEEEFTLKFLSTLKYEMWVPYEHKKENPSVTIVPLHNHETLSKAQILYQKALGDENMDTEWSFTPKFLEKISKTEFEKFQEIIDKDYFSSDTFFASNPECKEVISGTKERDDELEPRLRKVVSENPQTTVFVCGNHHFFADYGQNLYERLKDLSPIRIRLPELDKF